MPTTPIRRVRFPDGEIEYRSTRGELAVGTVIRSRGTLWRVAAHEGETVVVARHVPADGPLAAPSIGESLPLPLGVEPPTFEVMTSA